MFHAAAVKFGVPTTFATVHTNKEQHELYLCIREKHFLDKILILDARSP